MLMHGHAPVSMHLLLKVQQKFDGLNFECPVKNYQKSPIKICAIL